MQSQYNIFISPEIYNLIFLKDNIHWVARSEMDGGKRTTKSLSSLINKA